VLVIEASCLVLQCLSYPCHWFDLQNQFGRHISSLSRIFYYTMQLIMLKVKQGVLFYNSSPQQLNAFADAFASNGVPDAIRLFSVIDASL
jgi:hypothetical protein